MQNNTTALAVLNEGTAKIIRSVQHDFESVPNLKLDFQREYGYALQAIAGNKSLADAAMKYPESLQMAIYNVATTGLSLNPVLRYAYLIVRNGRVCLDPSYMGLAKLVTNAGSVRFLQADVVRQNDELNFSRGTNYFINHDYDIRANEAERGELIAGYCIAQLVTGERPFEIMQRFEIEKIRNLSESWKAAVRDRKENQNIWFKHEGEMWKKTVIRRMIKLLPTGEVSDNLIAAIAIHDEDYAPLSLPESRPRLIPVTDERDLLLSDWSEKIKAIETAEDFNPMFRAVRELPDNLKAAVSEKVKARARELGLNYSKENDEFFFPPVAAETVEDFEESEAIQ